MRVVIDTNVFVSAAMREKSPPCLALLLVVNKHQLLMSDPARDELFRVMAKPSLARFISPRFVAWLSKDVLRLKAKTVEITQHVHECRDPEDDKWLDLALNGQADVIVTGDEDLLVLQSFRGIPILSPAAFLAWAE